MKKTLLFTIGMMISLTGGMAVSQAMLAGDDNGDLLESIFEEAGVNFDDKRDTKELENLASTEAPFSNLYLFMLQNVNDGPTDDAIEEIANRYGYTEDEIESIVLRGSAKEIIEKKQTEAQEAEIAENAQQLADAQAQADADMEEFLASNDFGENTEEYLRWYYEEYEAPPSQGELETRLTSEFLLNEYNVLSDAFDAELAFQQENRRLGYEALASEMFFNNDLSDSANIDILYDLDLIHYLMFGDFITYPDRSGDEDVETASEEEEPVLFKTPEQTDTVDLAEEEPVNPYVCYGDENLANALTAYEEAPPDTSDALPEDEGSSNIDYNIGDDDEESSPDVEDSGDDDDDSSVDSGGGEAESNPYKVDLGSAFEKLDDLLSSFEDFNKSNWTRNLPCNDVYCIEVKFVNESDDAEVDTERYEETENCIACHIQFIKERLEETMSKSLVPSKITMNWFEDATCKDAGKMINLDLNVYAIKKPIDLDPGDDTDDIANEDINEFKTKLFGIAGLPLPGGTKTTLGKTKAEQDCQSILNLHETSKTERAIDDLLNQCEEAADETAAEIQTAFEEFKMESYSQSTSELYGQVSQELYSMLLYFQTFQEGLQASYLTEDAPLANLLTKGYCE